MGEPQKVECPWVGEIPSLSVGVVRLGWLEPHQACLLRVDRQAVLAHPLGGPKRGRGDRSGGAARISSNYLAPVSAPFLFPLAAPRGILPQPPIVDLGTVLFPERGARMRGQMIGRAGTVRMVGPQGGGSNCRVHR